MSLRSKAATKITRRSSFGRAAVDTDGLTRRDVVQTPPDRRRKSNVEVASSTRRVLRKGPLVK